MADLHTADASQHTHNVSTRGFHRLAARTDAGDARTPQSTSTEKPAARNRDGKTA